MRVYKFLRAEIARKVIREQRLKISRLDQTNDPFDLAAVRLVANRNLDPFLIQFFTENYLPVLAKMTGMMCFTATWDNPVLWAHYAEEHKGIVLGFEIKPGAAELRRVRYVRKKKARDISFILEAMRDAVREERRIEQTDPFANDAIKVFREILSTKFCDWAYEREIRTFAEVKEKDGEHYFFALGDHTRLVEVILGIRSEIEIQQILNDIVNYADEIKVAKAIASKTDFKILEDQTKTVTHTIRRRFDSD